MRARRWQLTGRPMNKHSAEYGRGTVELEEEATETRSQVLERIKQVLSSPTFRPPMLPKAAMEVLELSRRSDVSVQQIQAVLERDSMLAGEVLKLARSARYRGDAPVFRLKDALVRIGVSGLRNLVLEAATSVTIFKAGAYTEAAESVGRHSAAVARLSRGIARFTSVEAEFAFLLGLVHDIGLVTALIALGLDAKKSKAPLTLIQWTVAESVHEPLSARVATDWGLPPEVSWVLQSHHAFERDAKKQHPAIAVLAAAEVLAHECGCASAPKLFDASTAVGFEPTDVRPAEQFQIACEQLKLSAAIRVQLQRDARAVVQDEAA